MQNMLVVDDYFAEQAGVGLTQEVLDNVFTLRILFCLSQKRWRTRLMFETWDDRARKQPLTCSQ